MKFVYLTVVALLICDVALATQSSSHYAAQISQAFQNANHPSAKLDDNDMLMVYGGQDISHKPIKHLKFNA